MLRIKKQGTCRKTSLKATRNYVSKRKHKGGENTKKIRRQDKYKITMEINNYKRHHQNMAK